MALPKVVRHPTTQSFPTVPPPALLKWELATADDRRVSATMNISTFSTGEQHFEITQGNAALYGVDWAAWEAAVVDSAFTRSLLTFGSTTKEAPVARSFPIGSPFRLDLIGFNLHNYGWPSGPPGLIYAPSANAGAVSNIDVLEPATCVFFVIGLVTMLRHVPRPSATQ